MSSVYSQSDRFISPTVGGRVTFHSVRWSQDAAAVIPTGGDLNFHAIPERGTPPHTHEFAEIILVMTGKIRHSVNGEYQDLNGGNLIFIRPSDTHAFRPFRGESCEMVILSFRLETLLALSHYLESDAFMWKFTAPPLPPLFPLSVAETETLGVDMLSLNAAAAGPPQTLKVKVKIMLAELFTRYFLEDRYFLRENSVPEWMETLCREMRRPENFIVGLKRMRKLACRAPEHLCKSFRKYLGKTPTEFINEQRVHYAARQLVDTNEEIMAIALDLNFQSLSRFYHLFHQYYGVSPAKYRSQSKVRVGVI